MAKFMENASDIKRSVSKPKKKKKEETVKKVQSPSVSKQAQQTVNRLNQKYSGGSTRQQTVKKPAGTSQKNTSQNNTRNVSQQTQRTIDRLNTKYGQNRVERPQAQERRFQPNSSSTQRISRNPRLLDTASNVNPDRNPEKPINRAVRNTPKVVKESLKQIAAGHGKTAADITSLNESANIGAKIDIKSKEFQEDIQGRRVKSTEAANKAYDEISKIQDKSEKNMQKLTKNAKGLEKAYYGALESGIGMATDQMLGPAWAVSMMSRTYGNNRGKAQQEGATENEDRANALLQGAKEVATEYLFRGVGLASNLSGRVSLSPSERLAKAATRNMTGTAADVTHAGIRLLGGTAEENAEELIGWGLDPLISEVAYKRNVRSREAQQMLKAQSDDLRSNITSAEDARAIAAYLGSDDFIESNMKTYMDSGIGEAEARELAEKMRDYLTASLTGDTETMADIEDELSKTLSGKGLGKEQWSLSELMDTVASTTLLTMATGLPGSMSSAARGAAFLDNNSTERIRALADTAVDFENKEMSLKAEAMRDRIDSGKELTSTQAYDLMQGVAEQYQKDSDRQQAAFKVAENTINEENMVAPFEMSRTGNIRMGEVTNKEYKSNTREAKRSIETLVESDESMSLTDEAIDRGSRAIAGFKTGVFTVDDANELNYRNTAVRDAFKAETGIDLDEYIVKDKNGNVDIPATNTATKNALFAQAADNLVKSAQAETANWMDNTKGEVVAQISKRMGAQGAVDLQYVLDDVDERDRATYMMTANVADVMYQQGRNLGVEWDSVKADAKRLAPGISEEKLREMYEAGRFDRERASDNARGQQVKIGEKVALAKDNEAPMGQVLIDTDKPVKGTVIRAFSEIAKNLGVDIHLVDHFTDKNGKVLRNVNGEYINGAIYINVNSKFEKNIGYIFMHEVTHHLKKFAPEQYQELENLVRERWFKYDPAQMQNEIAKKIAAYERNGQKLTEEQALEEIIADAAHEFLNDRNFANAVAEENPSVAQAVLNTIRNALRMLRRVLATGSIEDETHMNTLFSQLDILDEAERLWLGAYTQAVKNKAAVDIENLQNRIYEEGRQSISEKPSRKMSDRWENGEKLTHSQFNSWYSAHKLNLRQHDNLADQIADIKENGFISNTAMSNVMPASINDYGGMDWAKRTYGARKGDTVLLVPRPYVDLKNDIIKNGFKPRDYEIVTVERDFQPYYELYEKAYDQYSENEGRYSIADMPSIDELDQTNSTIEDADGNMVAEFQDNGSVRFSISSFDASGREIYQEYLNKQVKNGSLSRKEADDMMREIETIYGIAKEFADKTDEDGNPVYAPFSAWSYADVVTDDKGKPVFSAIKKNSEYKMNIDFSTICKKRRTLDAVFREMINRGMLEKLDLNKDESAAMVVNINNLIRQHKFEAACALCFVEARRYRQQQTATTFRDMWNKLVESMYTGNNKAAYFNFGEDSTVEDVPNAIHTLDDSDLDLTYIKKIANEKDENGKKKQTAEAKAARLLLNDPSQRKLMRVGDMMASTGFENMQIKNPELMKVYNSKKGTGGAKSSFGDVQYLNEILKPRTFGRMAAYAVSGVRIQSFSDYVPRMVFDYVQVIADLAAKRLPAHGYTKEPLFVKQFGLTGAKINMSLVPDVVPDGKAPGLDKDGNYIWNEDGTFPYDEAMAIQKAKGYKENCGTIAVGISDEHILKMLADPTIQMVIPYHKSSLNPIVAAMTNVDRFENYEPYQNTKDENGNAVKKDFDWDRKLFRLSHDSKGKMLPKEQWGNVQDLVKEYADWCKEKNYTPKFAQFLYMEDGSINPGYYKLLEDFALLDNDGNFKPQGDVQMRFPTESDAFGSMESLIKQGLTEDAELEAKRSAEIGTIVDEIEGLFNEGTLTEQSATSEKLAARMSISEDLDEPYMDAVNSGDMEEAQRLVDEAALTMPNVAKTSRGRMTKPLKLYHGTRYFGFTEFKDSKHEAPFIYTSTDRTVSAHYAGDEHYAGVREIGKPYRESSNAEDVIENARYVLGADMKLMSKDDKVARFNQVKKDVVEVADKIDKYADAWRNSEEKYELDDYISNAIAWMEMPFWDVRDGDLQYDFDNDTEENKEWKENLEHDLDMYDQDREIVKDFYGDNYNLLPKDLKLYLSYLIGYEASDAVIDMRYGMLRSATNEDVLSNMNNENIVAPADLKSRMDSIKDIGAYELYGDLGENPFEFDAGGAQWYALQVPEVDSDHYVSTDNVCKWAYENGYTSVIMHNIRDYGDKADNYVFFNSGQLKSADPVTYAEDGSVIPLSERFDPSNNDIRYSLPTQDSDGNILSDGQMEYFQNSQARDDQGRLIPMYHVTPVGGFTIFDPAYSSDQRSISFTNDMDFALNYSSEDEDIDAYRTAYETRLGDGETEGLGHYKVYLNMQNPYIVDGSGIVFNDEVAELTAYAQGEGYDGLIMRNFQELDADIYQVFSGNQVKDTRNTDPTENPDIRFSFSDEEETLDSIAREADTTDAIPSRDPILEEGRIRMSISEEDFIAKTSSTWNEADLTHGMLLDEDSVKRNIIKMMSYVMKDSGTGRKYRSDTLDETIKSATIMFHLAKAGREEKASEYAWNAARRIVDDIDYNDDLYTKYKDMREYLHKTKIAVPEGLEYDESFIEFARDNRDRLLLKDKGRTVDSVYNSLRKKWPEMFAEDVTDPIDQLLQIDYVLNYIQPYREAYTSEEYATLVDQVATSLCDIVAQGEEYHSVADDLTEKYDAKVKAMKQRHTEAQRKLRENLEAKRENQRQRAENWKQKYQDRIKKDAEDKAERRRKDFHKKKFDRIADDYDWLSKAVLDPTKDKYIPEAFRKSLADLLVLIDLQTENSKKLEEKYGRVAQKTLKMRELKDRLNDLSSKKAADDTNLFDIDNYLPYLMDAMAEKLDGQSIDAMDAEDINTISILFQSIKKNFQNLNRETAEARTAVAENKATKIVTESATKVSRDGKARLKDEGLSGALDTINVTALTPAYLFERLGTMNDLYKELRGGFDTYIRNEAVIKRRLEEILSGYYKTRRLRKNRPRPGSEIEEWRDSRSAKELQLSNGTLTLTVAQRMSLYCLAQREQAKKHMFVGGIVATPIEAGSKIEAFRQKRKGKDGWSETRVLNQADLQIIETSLTKEQIKVAQQLQELMSKDMARLGNEAHREMYGYEIFGEENYFPIKSRDTWVPMDVNNMNDAMEKIKSFGPAKPLNVNASNAIVVDDIFSVVADHCNGMNLYNAYLVPISNFMRVYNMTVTLENGTRKPVREALKEAYGEKIVTYINNLIRDINGIKNTNRGGLEDVMNKALGTAKKTAVFGNIRVALQQPTAVVRALAVMDPKYFTPFLKVAPQKGVKEEMYKYCPIAQWKNWGYYDTYMGADIEDVMMNNWSVSDVALSGLYGELDNWTWSLIWRAVKAEMHDKYPDMDVKSEEFLQLCGDRASEVFDKTQVVDSTFHRSDAMRNKQIAVKAFTAFMAEPTLTLNVLRAGLYEAHEAALNGQKGKAAAIRSRAFAVIILQAAIVSAAQAFADAWRGKDPGLPGDDDDDDDKEAGYWERWIHNYLYNLFDGLHLENNMYLIKDVTPSINYMLSKATDYHDVNPWIRAIMGWDQDYLFSQNNLVFSALETLARGVEQAYKKKAKGDDYDKTWYDINQKVASGVGTFTGIPLGTLMRDFKPIWDKVIGSAFAADEVASKETSKEPVSKEDVKGVEKGSIIDRILGRNKSDDEADAEDAIKTEEEKKAAEQEKIASIQEKVADLSGEAKDKKVWSAVTTFHKEQNEDKALSEYIEDGDFVEIENLRSMYVKCGGDPAYFEERIYSGAKKALKKTIINDPTAEQIEAQWNIKNYLTSHGMSATEMSEIAYKSDTAKDLKVAFRINDENAIIDELVPLIRAGLTREDYERLYKNRNRIDLKKYRDGGGKYADRLKSTGVYNWPINGQITSGFGHRSSPGGIGSTNHQGLDIAGSMGDPVAAADGGTVVYAGWYGGAGKTVMIEHDDGVITQYSHLSWWDAKVGDTVAQGQTIGNVGSTGNSTGPHLHFGVKVNGSYVNPLDYLN